MMGSQSGIDCNWCVSAYSPPLTSVIPMLTLRYYRRLEANLFERTRPGGGNYGTALVQAIDSVRT
jgi:hypothetical protein